MDLSYVHVYYSALPALLFRILYGIPYAITEHSSAFIREELSFFDKMKARLYYRYTSANLPVSANLGGKLKKLGVKKEYKVVPNVYDPGIFFPFERENKSTVIKMLFVGNLVELKGLKYLFSAFKELKRRDYVINLIGDGPLKEELAVLAGTTGVSSNIVFLGRKSKQEIAEVMRNSDFLVLPSITENLPCVIIEAFACGLPVLASSVGGIPEIVKEENGFLVKPGDTAAWTVALDFFLDEFKMYDKQKIAAEALSNFSYMAIGETLSKIFSEIIRRGNKS